HHRGTAPRPVEGRAVDRGGDRKRRAGVCGAQRPQARRGGAALARGPDRAPDLARHFRRAASARQAREPCASCRSGVLKRREHVRVTALVARAGIGTLYTRSLYRTVTRDSWDAPRGGGVARVSPILRRTNEYGTQFVGEQRPGSIQPANFAPGAER